MSDGSPVAALVTLRERERLRLGVVAAGALVGLLVAWFHWVGLFVGGALVALPTRSLPRGVGAGVGFGALALAAHLVTLWWAGVLGPAAGAGLPFYVSVAVGLAFALLGSLVRGVV